MFWIEGDATFFKRVKLLVRAGYALNSFINRQILSSCKYAFMGILRNIQQSSSHDSSGNQEQNKYSQNKPITGFQRLFAAYLNLLHSKVWLYIFMQHSLPSYRFDCIQYAGSYHFMSAYSIFFCNSQHHSIHIVLWQTVHGKSAYMTLCRKSWYSDIFSMWPTFGGK